jgi:uncharacterized membrane protein YhaH (DUF805 family)
LSNPYNAPAADLSQLDDSAHTYEPQLIALSGRIGRARYLAYAYTFAMAVTFGALLVVGLLAVISPKLSYALMAVVYIGMLVLGFGYSRRRLNDMNRSGWGSLLFFIPVVGFGALLWLVCVPGDEGVNDFGPPAVPNSTGVVIAAVAMPVLLIALIGVLAAVALPAYQDYVNKAKAAQMRNAPAPALPDASQ